MDFVKKNLIKLNRVVKGLKLNPGFKKIGFSKNIMQNQVEMTKKWMVKVDYPM